MAKIIKFPMSVPMIRRVNQNKSYERALLAAEVMKMSEETHIKGEQYQQQRLDRDFQNQQRYNDNVRQQNRNGRSQRSIQKGLNY